MKNAMSVTGAHLQDNTETGYLQGEFNLCALKVHKQSDNFDFNSSKRVPSEKYLKRDCLTY